MTDTSPSAHQHLANEAHALLGRLRQTEPFSVAMPMVAAAGVSKEALGAITAHWARQRAVLVEEITRFIARIQRVDPKNGEASAWQSRFCALKLRFNSLLDQFDIFADVVSQRAEHKTGIWIAGLDILASDALHLGIAGFRPPPLMCFLERGHGAAIRKARTRLPGGDANPVAIIQVPRERLVGSGIASSIVHEVGHQGVALLELMPSLRMAMNGVSAPEAYRTAWGMLRRWLSEILADFWALCQLGVGATLGLMSVVSLPSYFMFRIKMDDPHPFPWIRVMISLAFGEALYPDPQWARLRTLWQQLYPVENQSPEVQHAVRQLLEVLPAFTQMVIRHHNAQTGNRPFASLFPIERRQPDQLRRLNGNRREMEKMPPVLAFAVVGQARADGKIANDAESRLLSRLLILWARKRAE